MTLKSMKISKAEQDKYATKTVGQPEPPEYPYGLRITLDEESLEKLGIKGLPGVGMMTKVVAVGHVCDVSMNESTDKNSPKRRRAAIQITEMEVEFRDETPTADKLYGKKKTKE